MVYLLIAVDRNLDFVPHLQITQKTQAHARKETMEGLLTSPVGSPGVNWSIFAADSTSICDHLQAGQFCFLEANMVSTRKFCDVVVTSRVLCVTRLFLWPEVPHLHGFLLRTEVLKVGQSPDLCLLHGFCSKCPFLMTLMRTSLRENASESYISSFENGERFMNPRNTISSFQNNESTEFEKQSLHAFYTSIQRSFQRVSFGAVAKYENTQSCS